MICDVLSVGIEPALQDPQSCVLSIERREQKIKTQKHSLKCFRVFVFHITIV